MYYQFLLLFKGLLSMTTIINLHVQIVSDLICGSIFRLSFVFCWHVPIVCWAFASFRTQDSTDSFCTSLATLRIQETQLGVRCSYCCWCTCSYSSIFASIYMLKNSFCLEFQPICKILPRYVLHNCISFFSSEKPVPLIRLFIHLHNSLISRK